MKRCIFILLFYESFFFLNVKLIEVYTICIGTFLATKYDRYDQ